MCKKIITFDESKTEKQNFHHYKNPIFPKDEYIDNKLTSNRVSSGEKIYKCIIGYMDDDYKTKPLSIMLPKSSAYLEICDGKTKWMYFFDLR